VEIEIDLSSAGAHPSRQSGSRYLSGVDLDR
jgi:hypothetical protein